MSEVLLHASRSRCQAARLCRPPNPREISSPPLSSPPISSPFSAFSIIAVAGFNHPHSIVCRKWSLYRPPMAHTMALVQTSNYIIQNIALSWLSNRHFDHPASPGLCEEAFSHERGAPFSMHAIIAMAKARQKLYTFKLEGWWQRKIGVRCWCSRIHVHDPS